MKYIRISIIVLLTFSVGQTEEDGQSQIEESESQLKPPEILKMNEPEEEKSNPERREEASGDGDLEEQQSESASGQEPTDPPQA